MAMPTRPTYHFTAMKPTNSKATTMAVPAPSRNVTSIIHSPERSAMLCRYPSKLCDMLRSEKRGGGLHRFCAYHRERANINQRRVDHRRRLRKKGLPVPPLERAPSHWQTDASPRHSDFQGGVSHYSDGGFMKEEQFPHDQDDELMSAAHEVELFDANESAQPLLPDFSETDLQELMRLLDHVDAEPTLFSIKEERVADVNDVHFA